MTIQEVGSIGELLAAIATLFYLARQVQANTRQAQTASRVEITRDYRVTTAALFDPEIANAFAIGLRHYPDMPFKNSSYFATQMANYALCFQGVFAHFDNGQLEDETYYYYLAFFSGLVATPDGSRWWEDVGRPIFVNSAVVAVDECIAKGAFPDLLEKAYPMPDVDGQQ